MIEVFIEKQKADVSAEFSALISYAIDDVKDFGAKNTAVSKTLVMPGTKRNNALFGNIFEVTGSNSYNPLVDNVGINFNPAVSARVIVFQENMQVLKGIMQLLEIVVDDGLIEYEVAFFGELAGLVNKLGNKKLEDLDFSAHDHVYNIANITASWANGSSGAGYVYPLSDYGTYSTGKHNWEYRTLRPALFAKEFIDKIFAAAGYSYDCAKFNTTDFKSIVIPQNQKKLTKSSSEVAIATVNTPYVINLSASLTTSLAFNTFSGTNFTIDGTNKIITKTVAAITSNISILVDFEYTLDYDATISFKQNAITLAQATLSASPGNTVPFTFSIDIPAASIAIGNIFKIVFTSTAPPVGGGTNDINIFIASLSFSTALPVIIDVNLGDSVSLNACIPKNILQKDFISSILKLSNLYVFEDTEQDRVLKIMPFVDFYAGATSIDWTGKIDRSRPIKYKPMSELNARYYDFAYKDDSDYYNDLYKKRYNLGYGSYIYDSQFEFSKETTKVDIIFSGTPIVGYTGEDKVYSTIFKRTGTDAAPVEENTDSNIRLLYCKLITGVSSWTILADDGATVLSTQTQYLYAGHLDSPDVPTKDLNFGVVKELFFNLATGALNNNQFNIYWSSYLAEITDKDSKLLIGVFFLSKKDIYGLDFSKLIYIDGALWRLNKITDYNASHEDICNVELLKVINKIY